MQKLGNLIKTTFILILISILSLNNISFADEIEEETDYIWVQEEIENASANATEEPVLNSRYIVAFDRTSKTVLFGKNENQMVPMASTTKIMTAIVLIENLNDNLNLDTEIEVCKEAGAIGGSRLGLKKGDKITVNNLLYGLMLCSGNDAAIQIAVSVAGSVENFANLMNKKAEELNLDHTHFITPHGLDEEGHYTTAYELAQIADYALNIDIINQVVKTKTYNVNINGYNKAITNTNELLGYLNGVNGVKTGFTNGAGRCLVTSVERNGFDIITVVLGADTKKIRTRDSINLIEYVYERYKLLNLEEIIDNEFSKWKMININRIIINKGERRKLEVGLGEIQYKIYPVKNDEIENIRITIDSIKYLNAPVKANTKIGEIKVEIGKRDIYSVDILTKNEINKKSVERYILELIGNMAHN